MSSATFQFHNSILSAFTTFNKLLRMNFSAFMKVKTISIKRIHNVNMKVQYLINLYMDVWKISHLNYNSFCLVIKKKVTSMALFLLVCLLF